MTESKLLSPERLEEIRSAELPRGRGVVFLAELLDHISALEARLAEREGLEQGTESTPKVKWMDASLRSRTFLTPTPLEAEKALGWARMCGRYDGIEESARLVENGRFLHDDAPTARFARECAAAIRRLLSATVPAQEAKPPEEDENSAYVSRVHLSLLRRAEAAEALLHQCVEALERKVGRAFDMGVEVCAWCRWAENEGHTSGCATHANAAARAHLEGKP